MPVAASPYCLPKPDQEECYGITWDEILCFDTETTGLDANAEILQRRPQGTQPAYTNETITLPARRVVVFRSSRKFRAELNGEVAL